MADYTVAPGSTSVSIVMFLHDPVTNGPNTGLTIANLDMSYTRPGAADVTVNAVALAAVDTAYTSGRMIEIDATNSPGVYRADFADAAYAAGVHSINLTILDGSGNVINSSTVQTGTPEVDAVKISGDSTAADNLELQYDTTGLAGDTFPATQAQIAGISNVGSAVNTTASSYNLTTGTQSSGTYASTAALDGTNHEHTDVGNAMELYYEFTIGAGIPTSVTMTGYLNGNNDDLSVWGYDWVAVGWVQIGTLEGKAASTNEVNSYEMFTTMVGNGANEGKVRVRFYAASGLTTATLAVDQILCSFSRGNEGYENGAIWIDTTVSNTNTVVGVDGTARNPVSTIAAANTLSASTNLNRFEVAPGSTITFAATQDDQIFNGHDWTLALGSQSISGSHITGAIVSGIATGASPPTFVDCTINATTVPPCEMRRCGFANTITAGSAGDFFFNACFSEVAGSGTPVFDFGSGLNSSDVSFRHYSGGIHIHYMGAGTGTYAMSLEGHGQLIINANCSATGSVSIRGNFIVTDNASGAITLSDEARFDVTQVTGGAWALDTDSNGRIRIVDGTGAGEINTASGIVPSNLSEILGTALTETSGLLAGGFKKFFNIATPTGTLDSIPDAVPGAAGGLFIAGTNAATSITTALTANIIGNITGALSGAVGSVGTGGIVAATFGASAITAGAIAVGAITAEKLGADAITAAKIADGAIDNATFAADVQSTAYATNIIAQAVNNALVQNNLDHLMKTAVANNADMSTEVTDGTIISNILSATSTTSTYVVSTDSLEAMSVVLAAVTTISNEEHNIDTHVHVVDSG